MSVEIKGLTLISGNRSRRGIVERDRFSLGNIFCRGALMIGFPISLHQDVRGSRGGIKADVLSIWVSEIQAIKLDEIYKRASKYSTYHLIQAVNLGLEGEIGLLINRPEEFYRKNPGIIFRDVYDRKFLEQCYKRSYERRHPAYRNNLGHLSNPNEHSPYFLSLDQRNIHPVVPKQLQRAVAADVIGSIITIYPEFAP